MKKLFLFISCAAGMCMLIACNSGKTPEQTVETGGEPSVSAIIPTAVDGSNVVYVKLDSLISNYQMMKDLDAELEEKMKKLDAELTNKQKTFQSNVTDLQNKAQKGLETRARLAEMEQQLGVEQQNLMQLGESYRVQIAEEQTVNNRKVLQAIMDYLKEYNQDRRYKYILGDAFDGKILYADPSLDITASVLEGINAKYQADHPAKK